MVHSVQHFAPDYRHVMRNAMSTFIANKFHTIQVLISNAATGVLLLPVREWKNLPSHLRQDISTDNSDDNWKHFCSGWTNHDASRQSAYLRSRKTLITDLLTFLLTVFYLSPRACLRNKYLVLTRKDTGSSNLFNPIYHRCSPHPRQLWLACSRTCLAA